MADKMRKRPLELFCLSEDHPGVTVREHVHKLGPEHNSIETSIGLSDGFEIDARHEEENRPELAEKREKLIRVLKEHFLFSGTPQPFLESVVQHLTLLVAREGDVIVREGDFGDTMFILESGELHVTNSNSGADVVDVVLPHLVFGELAVLYDSRRAATVTVSSPTATLWSLSRATLQLLDKSAMAAKLDERTWQLSRILDLDKLDPAKLRRIAVVMKEETFEAGTVICRQGEVLETGKNDKFYAIQSGSVQVSVAMSSSRSRGGSQAMYHLEGLVESLELPEERLLGDGSSTSSSEESQTLRGSLDASFDSHSESKEVAILEGGQWFGEMSLLSDDPRSATVVALERTTCYTLSRSAFNQIVSKTDGVIRRIASTSELRKEDNHETIFRHERLDVASRLTTLESLRVRHVIGEGAFSVVRLATLRDEESDSSQRQAFALKTMNKQDLANRKQVLHVNTERSILEQSSHAFILSLIRTFQTPHHIYMLFELVQGGELFTRVINSNGGLPVNQVQFNMACITEGLSYLHRKHIAYRDLKLENLVISADGYIKIIDFGFAKRLEGEGETTKTLCGTPDYLAPEAVTRVGHSWPVDCWSLGVLCFEMLTQFSPFADTSGNNNHMVVFKRILQGPSGVDWQQLKRVLPTDEDFLLVKDMLCALWESDPRKRMSCAQLKEPHPYFADIPFQSLREKLIPAPWTPTISNYMDTSHFDVAAFDRVRESSRPYTGDQEPFKAF